MQKLSKKELKSDEFIGLAATLIDRVRKSPKRTTICLIAILTVIISVPLFFSHQRSLNELALDKFLQAYNYYTQRDYTKALEGFDEILSKHPRTKSAPDALFYTGQCHYYLKDYDEAIQAYQGYLRRYHHLFFSPNALEGIGYCYEAQGNYQEAISAYQRLLEDCPGHYLSGQIQLNIGRCYEEAKDWARAKEAYQNVLDFYTDSSSKDSAQSRLKWIDANIDE
jgi:TolA-binding protein